MGAFKSNNLGGSTSPYLRQHAANPVWWQEWGQGVLEAAAAEGKPLFVSVGYSTCHWCHVMAAGAFSDRETADFLNSRFLCVKVDRETRPDIDQYLMNFLQSQSGSGGWPLNVFLLPDLRPVYALTYAPPVDRDGLMSLLSIARRVHEFISTNQGKIDRFQYQEVAPEQTERKNIHAQLSAFYDPQYGGFGRGQKFPPHTTLLYMLYDLSADPHPGLDSMCRRTLDAIRLGGLHDHLQGGIFRYCVDREWIIPHFEKMLYDQSMALWCFALGRRVLNDPAYERMALGIVDCLEETFLSDGLYTTGMDADTDHQEGVTYLWRYDELRAALAPDEFLQFSAAFNLPQLGNFEGLIHFTRKNDRLVRKIEDKLLAIRRKRPQPFRDEKVLCGLNGLTVCALIQTARLLGRPELEQRAETLTFRLIDLFWDGIHMNHALAQGIIQKQSYLFDAAAMLLAVTMLREMRPGWGKIMDELAGYVSGFNRDGTWLESAASDFLPVSASWFDHPIPSSVSLATLGLVRAAVLNGANFESLEYRPAQQGDFFNIAVLLSQGLFHQIHTPTVIPWSQLPANSIQIQDTKKMDCFKNACRLLTID